MELQTERLNVVLQTHEEVEHLIARMSEDERAQISAEWLARLWASPAAAPWVQACRVVHRATGAVVGTCSFKGPPVGGVVEIAYGIEAAHAGQRYATEVTRALVAYASACGEVRLVRAHTLPEGAASQRVLVKCSFRYVGEIVDPDDGPVSRFERSVGDTAGAA